MNRTTTEAIPRLALTSRQAAESLGISERLLFDWRREHNIPVVEIDRTVRYPVKDLESWLSKNANNAGLAC